METVENIVRGIVQDELAKRSPLAQSGVTVVPESPNRLYSIRSAAELLGVSDDYIYERIHRGEISVVELGDSRPKQRIAAPELKRFIEARTYPK